MKLTQRFYKALQILTGQNPYQSGASIGANRQSTADLNVLKGFAFACIEKRASAFANIENYISVKGERVENHPLQDVLFGNSPVTNLTWSEEKKQIQWWLDKTGNVFIWYPIENGKISKRVFIPSNCVYKTTQGRYNLIESYSVRLGSNTFEVPYTEMFHYKTLKPSNDLNYSVYMGSPLLVDSVANVINADAEMFDYITRYFENDAVPPLVFSSKNDLSPEQMEAIQYKVNSKFKNPPQSFFLTGDMEMSAFESKANDLSSVVVKDSLSQDIMNRICIAFGVTPTLLTGEFQNKSNAVEVNKQFYENTVEPLVYQFEDKLTGFLRQYDKELVIKHDSKEFQDTDDLRATIDLLGRYNWIKGDEAVKLFGFDPIIVPDAPIQLNPPQQLSFKGYELMPKYHLIQKSLVENYSNQYLKDIKPVMTKLEKEVLSNIAKSYKKSKTKAELNGTILFDLDKFMKDLIEATKDTTDNNINASLNQFLDDVGSNSSPDKFATDTQKTANEVNMRMSESGTTIDKELREVIRKTLNENSTLSKDEMLKLIQDVTKHQFTIYKGSRAELIAKETSQYVNESTKARSAKKLNLGLKWIHNNSDKPRPHHISMNGKPQNSQGIFVLSNGRSAKHPKGFGIADEDIGCNCSTIAYKL